MGNIMIGMVDEVQTYFARQPILDQNMRLYGYEMLYRGGPHADNSGNLVDGDAATAAVIEAFQVRGIDKLAGGKKAFVNFTQKLLLDGVPAYFPPQSLVVEILEDVDPTPELLEELRRLKSLGYMLALDDFVFRPALKPLLRLADIVKVDFFDSVFSMKNFYAVCSHINLAKCLLLAERVETHTAYEKARELGCQLFQGYFFARPTTMSEKTVGVMRINALRMMAEVSRDGIDFNRIAAIIKQDIGLTYKILKLVNSAYFGLVKEITDVKKAVVYLGQMELKKWISFAALVNMSDRKPPELIEMSLVRAHFCETVALHLQLPQESDAFFLTGLFSLLDIMLDTNIHSLLEDVTLPELSHTALTGGRGYMRDTLDLIIALEKGNWEEVLRLSNALSVDSGDMSDLYADSLQWSAELHLQEETG
ncbi:MAG: HDOD domain-containing protein [Oscillospiraceae bacterium]|jgi:EAL and modified HD-GYP domain-containing signal transduction protein|nr:HDOD domain-containing protein [Oscillospiraceae bacterium]